MKDLYYIIYSSTPAKKSGAADIENILVTARAENKRYNVTGMLVCLPDNYIQLIEGPQATINQLYQNIEQDPRHYRVTILKHGALAQRYFPDWAMAYDTTLSNVTDTEASLEITSDKVCQLFDILDG
jgi:hypothetical protein